MGKQFKILAIDGGGIRGVVPAHVLNCIESRLGINPSGYFDMFAGTSTGSIIAAGLACDIPTEKIVDLYKSSGQQIFKVKKSWWPKAIRAGAHSLYDNSSLGQKLKEIFGDVKLGEITKPLLLPSTDIGNGKVHVFKSNYSPEFNRDKDFFLRDAVLASCSAPTFFDPVMVKEYALADGGLWANNPSLAALIDAQFRLKNELRDIKLLSLGTGSSKKFYGADVNKNWGLISGWGHKNFISFLLSLQSESTNNYMQLLLEKEQLLRLDFESDLPLPLDNINSVQDLLSRADLMFTHKSLDIKTFLT